MKPFLWTPLPCRAPLGDLPLPASTSPAEIAGKQRFQMGAKGVEVNRIPFEESSNATDPLYVVFPLNCAVDTMRTL